MEQTLTRSDTFLSGRNIALLKRMFGSEEQWRSYMTTLWKLREVAYKRAEKSGLAEDTEYYNVFRLSNDLIGALLVDDIDISLRNGRVDFRKRDGH